MVRGCDETAQQMQCGGDGVMVLDVVHTSCDVRFADGGCGEEREYITEIRHTVRSDLLITVARFLNSKHHCCRAIVVQTQQNRPTQTKTTKKRQNRNTSILRCGLDNEILQTTTPTGQQHGHT